MPDWTYHPFFKPLLFRLPPEEARALTLRLLEIQGATAAGRRLFRLFAPRPPSSEHALTVFGRRFRSPVGLGPGIDTSASALTLLQHLGFGFLQVGPAGANAKPRRFAHDPLRLRDARAIVSTPLAEAPSAADLAERVARTVELSVPVGIALAGPDLAVAIRAARGAASFFTLPAEHAGELAELRALTDKPLLLRLPPTLDEGALDALLDAAIAAGIDGCVATAGAPCPLLEAGEMDGPFLRDQALRVVERIARRHGAALPIVGAGGIFTPEDALAFLDAGASLVELHAGFVYAGPGLPARILDALAARRAAPVSVPVPVPVPAAHPSLGPWLITATGAVLIASGIFALVLAATVKLLPYDVAYLQMTMTDLCDRNACRIVHFMAHDRVSFGGSIISIGALYAWLGRVPLQRGEAWAFWTALLSGVIGFGSFLTYLGYGYLDVWHGRATLALLPIFVVGLIRSFATLRGPRGIGSMFRAGARAWRYSPAGLGRACVTFTAFGMILGGLIIMGVGMTRVFVPQDLEFMNVTVADLHALNPRLVPLIAHDRAGFGGGLCSTGVAVMACLWCGARPGARSLWRAMLFAGVVGFATAIGVHPVVGYVSFTHLAPAYAGAIAFVIGMALLYAPMCRADAEGDRFPDV